MRPSLVPSPHFTPRLGLTLALTLIMAFHATTAIALDPIYSNWRDLAIRGTDPVAYFTEGRPVEGSSEHTFDYLDATWRFASAENKAAFEANPEKYTPQFGGYCAWAVAQGYTASIDPKAWTIVEGKLYLNYSEKVMNTWLEDRDKLIDAAEENWPALRDG